MLSAFFRKFSGVQAVLSEKKDGSMKVFLERSEENQENRMLYFARLGIPPERVVSAGLVHGTRVEIITAHNVTDKVRPSIISNKGESRREKMKGAILPETDGLVTKEKNLFLAVTAADCLPVFFYDPIAGVVGIAHAGWRGIIAGVVTQTLEKMSECGATKENISVAIGPHIRGCHFQIQTDILPQFSRYARYVINRDGGIFVDLEGIAREQLRRSGIFEARIETHSLCTFCEKERFFSYRRDKPEVPEVMVAVIGMQEKT